MMLFRSNVTLVFNLNLNIVLILVYILREGCVTCIDVYLPTSWKYLWASLWIVERDVSWTGRHVEPFVGKNEQKIECRGCHNRFNTGEYYDGLHFWLKSWLTLRTSGENIFVWMSGQKQSSFLCHALCSDTVPSLCNNFWLGNVRPSSRKIHISFFLLKETCKRTRWDEEWNNRNNRLFLRERE